MDHLGSSSSQQLAQAARQDVQPFFTARIFPLSSDEAAFDRQGLLALRLSLQRHLDDFLAGPQPHGAEGYVFYRSQPIISISRGIKKGTQVAPPHIKLSLSTGGATEDEFLLLHFLRLQQRPGSLLRDYAVQVIDEDGELLLIEAADHIPDWIDPDNAAGRVWLVQEEVKILPASLDKGDASFQEDAASIGPIADINTSLRLLQDHAAATSTSSDLNIAAFSRMATYPGTEWTDTVQHRTTSIVPSLSIARAFRSRPQLIARAGQAFLGRDARDARIASRMAKLLPQQSASTSLGAASAAVQAEPLGFPITLSRRLYTHLLSARYHPPQPFSSVYRDQVSSFWTALDSLASPETETSASEQERQQRASTLQEGRRWDLGCKLAVGLEIAFANDLERRSSANRRKHDVFASSSSSGAAHGSESEMDPRQRPDYGAFIARLESFGFFEGQMRGSKRWTELEEQAVKEWGVGRKAPAPSRAKDSSEEEDGEEDALGEWTQTPTLLASTPLPDLDVIPPTDLAALASLEQPDTWLYEVGSTFLDAGPDDLDGPSNEEQEAQARLSHFATQMEKFVEGKGDVEGALIDESGSEDDSEDEEEVREQVRERLAAMNDEQRDHELKRVLPGFAERPGWDKTGEQDSERMEEDLRAMEESQARLEAEESVAASSRQDDGADTAGPPSSGKRALSNAELRSSLASSAKALRSSNLSANNFEGAESWELGGSDDDAELDEDGNALPQLDEDGMPETKETRRRRAEMLGLEPSDDEDDEEEEDTVQVGAGEADKRSTFQDDVAEEMDEFLSFASKELGLTAGQLDKIMQQRRDEGRWVPGKEQKDQAPQQQASASSHPAAAASSTPEFGKGFGKGFLNKKARRPAALSAGAPPPASSLKKQTTSSNGASSAVEQDGISSVKPKRVAFSSDTKSSPTTASSPPQATVKSPPASSNPSSNPFSAFDTLLSALDDRLNQHRASKGLPPLTQEELQNAPIEGADWANRRPGGASLGSVFAKEQAEKEGRPAEDTPQPAGGAAARPGSDSQLKDPIEATASAVPSSATVDDGSDEDEDMLPLTAQDPAKLERLLREQVPETPTFKEMVEQLGKEREEKAKHTREEGHADEPVRLGDDMGHNRITELPSDAAEEIDRDAEMPGLESSDEEDESDEEMFPTIVPDAQQGEDGGMADLLESWRAQGGRPGPVGNLVGGMGIKGQAPR
ncbi:SGT1-domain-containing protein [Jaminaea rosea]|uniref:SGT1-domain-containing protein n=1 Tax=Jaminaea rosea TaxID=1569628 RepID=A0A316UWV3_9BASI|nr:SGT1-domain-containing protein [Jaminaea rosea]PWN29769.1 SGT1-domain-containing protein [Jaminaea rosea]